MISSNKTVYLLHIDLVLFCVQNFIFLAMTLFFHFSVYELALLRTCVAYLRGIVPLVGAKIHTRGSGHVDCFIPMA